MIKYKGSLQRGLRVGDRLVKPGETLGPGGDVELRAEDLKGFEGDSDFEVVSERAVEGEPQRQPSADVTSESLVEVNGQVIRDRRRGNVQ